VSELKIGIRIASLGQPLRRGLEMAAAMGARGVELEATGELRPRDLTRTAARQIRKLLDDLQLRPVALAFPTRRGYNVSDELDRRIAATRQAMQAAAWLGAPIVVNQIGLVPEQPEGPAWELLVEVLSDLGKYGQQTGALLAARTGSESGADLARLLAALPEFAIAVDLDPGGLIVNGLSPLEMVRAVGESILHVHARDAVRDLSRGRGLEVPLGRGSADFPGLLAALEEFSYTGFFTVERGPGEDPAADVAQAVEYLHNIGE